MCNVLHSFFFDLSPMTVAMVGTDTTLTNVLANQKILKCLTVRNMLRLPGQVISQISQGDQHPLPMFPRQAIRIAHGTHERAVIVTTDRNGQQFPVLSEVNTLVVFYSLDYGFRHERQIVRNRANFSYVELGVPVEGEGVTVGIPNQLKSVK
jgi:hypothetical protein